MDNKKCRGKNNGMKSCDSMGNLGWGTFNPNFPCTVTTALKLWNDIMLYYGHSTQTQLKSQTTKLDNVHMLFVTGHEKY